MMDENMELQAKENLKDFVDDTYKLLDELINQKGEWQRPEAMFPEAMLHYLRGAWSEFERDFNLQDAHKSIMDIRPDKLRHAGLYGNQLKLKLNVVEKFKSELASKFEVHKKSGIWGNFKNKIKGILIKLLNAIDTVLESVLAVSGLNTALKELKDVLLNLL